MVDESGQGLMQGSIESRCRAFMMFKPVSDVLQGNNVAPKVSMLKRVEDGAEST